MGDEIERDDLLERLVEAGYERVGSVDDRGQVAARGDIVDVFPTTGANPLRVELFGDEVERVSTFSVFTQRSLAVCERAVVYPASERLVAEPDLEAWVEDGERPPVPRGLVPLLPELIASAALAAWEPERVTEELGERLSEVGEHLPSAERGRAYVRLADAAELVESAARLDPLAPAPVSFEAQRPALAGRGLAEAENELRGLVGAGLRVAVSFPHRGDAERALLGLRRVEARVIDAGDPLPGRPGVYFIVSAARRGFVANRLHLALLPSTQVFRRRVAGGDLPRRLGRALASFADLRPGDHVVHEDHGVGRFVRFDTKTVAGVTRDYVELQFRGEDRLFVPHEQLGKVARYIGADGRAPALSKLGGKAWQTLKTRARVAVHELAGELLALYATRQTRTRPPLGDDDSWMERLEAAFPYAETEDQARAIDAVKGDLESERPMDRLICGDVGFGKTEVALRAAFKVATGGRQVLMLVPTTILAQQHGQTFRDRFRDFPLRVETVSRLRSKAETRTVLDDYAAGKVDVLIGTHRVLSRDVIPRNLGLVLVDEEQRFGVAQKELLRQLRLEVDVLSLSATPIPRTLHMSLAGLRDISVINTPPRGRRPIRTHVGEWDEELVAHAIRREHARGGQVFFLHNRVETIDEAAEKLRRAGARGARRRRARPDGRAPARERHAGVPARRPRRAGLDHHHRVRPRHPPGQHADRRAGGHARAGPALPDPRARRPLRRGGARVPLLPRGAGALGGARAAAWPPWPTTPSWARGTAWPCATSSSAAPATCWATSSRGTWRRSASSCTARCWPTPCASCRGRAWPRRPGRCGSTRRSTPTCPRPTCPWRRPRSTCTAASRWRSRPTSCARSRSSCRTASGRCRRRSRTSC